MICLTHGLFVHLDIDVVCFYGWHFFIRLQREIIPSSSPLFLSCFFLLFNFDTVLEIYYDILKLYTSASKSIHWNAECETIERLRFKRNQPNWDKTNRNIAPKAMISSKWTWVATRKNGAATITNTTILIVPFSNEHSWKKKSSVVQCLIERVSGRRENVWGTRCEVCGLLLLFFAPHLLHRSGL